MKKKELELKLQQIPNFENPNPVLEQYMTPADIAADIIFLAYQFGDIEDKIVVDLGCGTGIFSIGANITGAKKTIGFDIDNNCIQIAQSYSEKNNYDIVYLNQDIDSVNLKCDTVFMNPPFGAQKGNRKADRKFLEKSFEISKVVYSLHLSKTLVFIDKMIKALHGEIVFSKDYVFPVKHIFSFHEKKSVNFDVTLLRILTKT